MTEGGLLPAALLGPLSEACARGYTIVVADPFFAEALKAEMGYAQVQDLFSWASATLGVSKPDPVDLLLACREALTVIQSYKGDSLAGEWELAQRLGRDWQEVLLHTPSLREASAYWDELASHRQIQGLFSLYQDASLDWLGVLPLPQRKSDAMRVFWSCLREFLDAYQRALREKRKVLFSEEAIHRLLENPNWDRVLFLHLYSPYPLINKLLSIAYEKGVEIWGWDVKTLREHLPEVWDPLPPLTGAASWPDRVRPVSISELPSLVEVVEAAAQAVASYVKAQPTARVAVWCEEEIAFLFRHLFDRQGMGAFLSPSVLPLWAGTQVGKVLAEHMGSGLRGELSAWPSVECADSPQEKWVQRVYEWVCEKAHPGEPASWQFLLAFLQTHTPILSPFSPDTRVYVGRLTQLAGGAYDAVFIIQPSEEPLGRWSRPSFWLFSLRNRFFPRERHHQLSWRLQSLLLWGSREVHIWRQVGEEFRSPLEDFLRHTKLFELDRYFARSQGGTSVPVSSVSFSLPSPLSPDESPKPFLSPSQVGQLFVCPRRFYWSQLLKKRPLSEPAAIGLLMHQMIAAAFSSKRADENGKPTSLRKVAYKLSKRRCFYRLGKINSQREDSSEKVKWDRRHHLLKSFIAEAGQPLLHAGIALLLGPSHVLSSFSGRIRWHHLRDVREMCRFRSEVPISWRREEFQINGRVDLLIEQEQVEEETGEVRIKRYLLDMKQFIGGKVDIKFGKIEESIMKWVYNDSSFRSVEGFSESFFQIATYAMMLGEQGEEVSSGALVSLWWRPSSPRFVSRGASFGGGEVKGVPDHEKRGYVVFPADVLLGEKEVLWRVWREIGCRLPSKLSKGSSEFPLTADRRICKNCDFALLCDRLDM